MGRLPSVAKGKQVECVVCGYWFPERDTRITTQEGKIKCKWCVDKKTAKDIANERKS